MTVNMKYLSLMGYVGQGAGVRHWSYVTADTLASVDTAGYFNDASAMMKPGDLVYTTVVNTLAAFDAGTHTSTTGGVALVNSVSAGVVDIADHTVFGGTDTD